MRPGGSNFNYFSKNKLTQLANFVQFKRMLMFCPEDWGRGLGHLGYATGPYWLSVTFEVIQGR